jgi:hypothetical protein
MPLLGASGNLVAHPLDLVTLYPIRLSREGKEERVKKLLRTPQ